MMYLLGERELLCKAIRKTKSALEIDIDSETSLNLKRQELSRLFNKMNSLRGSETLVQNGGLGYRFNAEGNQVAYRCDIKKVTTINFDRNKVRNYLSALNKKADDISTKIDLCLVNSVVNYNPPFDVNDSFADVFENYIENTKK